MYPILSYQNIATLTPVYAACINNNNRIDSLRQICTIIRAISLPSKERMYKYQMRIKCTSTTQPVAIYPYFSYNNTQ